jgi:hypothetical protein
VVKINVCAADARKVDLGDDSPGPGSGMD